MLQLWRDRWGKTLEGIPNQPYARGTVHEWAYKLPASAIWNSLLARIFGIACCVFILFFSLQLDFTLNGQLSFAALVITMMLVARRFEGTLFTFILIILASVTSGQYFYWRFTKTIVYRSNAELLLSIGYCTLELLFTMYFFIRLTNQTWSTTYLHSGKRWKRLATNVCEMLYFYKFIGRLAIILLPVITLVIGFTIIKVQIEWIAPMAIPYFVALAILHERMESKRRWSLQKAMHEFLLACAMLFYNAIAFLRYSLHNPVLCFERTFYAPNENFVALKASIKFSLILLNLSAIFLGLTQLVITHALPNFFQSHSFNTFFILMALINIASLLSEQAVTHESRHIHWFTAARRILPATIVLESGRTIFCTTCNFPSNDLQLQLPRDSENSVGDTFVLQFCHSGQPFNLTVRADQQGRIRSSDDMIISVKCCSESLEDMAAFKDLVMVRDANWPTWLANQNADRLLPAWLSKALEVAPVMIIDWMTSTFGFISLKKLLNVFRKKSEN